MGRSILQAPNHILPLKEEVLVQKKLLSRQDKARSLKSQGANSANKQGKYISVRLILQKREFSNAFIICACNIKYISAQLMFYGGFFCRFCCNI